MPTYEYQCSHCDHHFEVYQSMLDKKLRKCPQCKKYKLHRLIGTGGGIIFKGTGFYETDFKTKKPEKSAENAPTGTVKNDPSSKSDSSGANSKPSAKNKVGTDDN